MKKYIILSLKYSTPGEAVFWRENDAGYTTNPWDAGIYSQEKVLSSPKYYNNGVDAVAIELNHVGLDKAGFKCVVDLDFLKKGGQS